MIFSAGGMETGRAPKSNDVNEVVAYRDSSEVVSTEGKIPAPQ